MEREQIIRELHKFKRRILDDSKLAENVFGREMEAILNAISLIKELTEENERLRWISASVCVEDVMTPDQMEELRAIPGHGDPVGEPGECVLKHKCVANTVRRMQSDIQEACLKGGVWPAFVAGVVKGVGDKILEENNVQITD